MVIFHSYASLPEGTLTQIHGMKHRFEGYNPGGWKGKAKRTIRGMIIALGDWQVSISSLHAAMAWAPACPLKNAALVPQDGDLPWLVMVDNGE